MGFAVCNTGTGTAPVVVCDQCGKHIREAAMATCYWGRADALTDMVIYVVHKECHRAFDQARNAGTWPTMELRHYLVDLADNMTISLNEWMGARDSADRMRTIG